MQLDYTRLKLAPTNESFIRLGLSFVVSFMIYGRELCIVTFVRYDLNHYILCEIEYY